MLFIVAFFIHQLICLLKYLPILFLKIASLFLCFEAPIILENIPAYSAHPYYIDQLAIS